MLQIEGTAYRECFNFIFTNNYTYKFKTVYGMIVKKGFNKQFMTYEYVLLKGAGCVY